MVYKHEESATVCKICKKEFHYCKKCKPDTMMELGYCCVKCAREGPEHKHAAILAEFLSTEGYEDKTARYILTIAEKEIGKKKDVVSLKH